MARPEAARQLVPNQPTELAFSLTPIGNLMHGPGSYLEVHVRTASGGRR